MKKRNYDATNSTWEELKKQSENIKKCDKKYFIEVFQQSSAYL